LRVGVFSIESDLAPLFDSGVAVKQDRARPDGGGVLSDGQVVMREIFPILKPKLFESDPIRESVQLVNRVGE